MLYVGIDQHTRQLTVCVRNEEGDVVLRRQVGTHLDQVVPFLEQIRDDAGASGGFVAIVEVCGFNGWLIELLEQMGCRETVVIQPEKASNRKTDRRDAARLSELLWVNRQRLLDGRRVQGLRRIELPAGQDAADRQITTLRQRFGAQRTQLINRIKRIIHKHNLIHDQPTKTFPTKAVQKWLRVLELPAIDRLELDLLLTQWELVEEQLTLVNTEIAERVVQEPRALRLMTIGGCGAFTALTIASRIGRIERFRSGRSLANFFGLTPTCSSSGESGDRLGHISKQGSSIARFLLGQLVTRVLRDDTLLRRWYSGIKRRRGAKIARVAVMRRLTTSIWHMLKYDEGYLPVALRQDVPRKPPQQPGISVPTTAKPLTSV
jgi:transposase